MALATDVLTLTEAKSRLSIEAAYTDADAIVASCVSAVSDALDDLCGPIVERTVTDETYNGGWPIIWLRTRPASAITTVVESGDTIPADEYQLDDGAELARLTVAGDLGSWKLGYRNVVVTYTAGRYADTASVPASRFKEAAGITLLNWFQQHRPAFAGGAADFDEPFTPFPKFGIPNAAVDILGDAIRPRRQY